MADSVTAAEIPSGWTTCENDEIVKEVAEFAVDEYNKEKEKSYELVKVLSAQTPTVNGLLMYKVSLEIKDDDGSKICEALVYDNVKDHCMKLCSFKFMELEISGWTDAGNDVGIEDLAKFAVDEYNKKEGTTLEFTKLKNAQKLLVNNILYRLTPEATDDGHTNLYQAMVKVVLTENIKELEDFKPLLLKR